MARLRPSSKTLQGIPDAIPPRLDGFCVSWNRVQLECSGDVVEALDATGQRLARGAYHKGGNVTKDSLYAVLSLEMFLNLCRTENCRSTEMELSAIVGVSPGSFSESERDKSAAEVRALRVALEAVKRLVMRS